MKYHVPNLLIIIPKRKNYVVVKLKYLEHDHDLDHDLDLDLDLDALHISLESSSNIIIVALIAFSSIRVYHIASI
jgi:hypothetical protein